MPNPPPKKQAKKSPQKKQGLLPPVSIAFPCRGGKGCCKLPDVMRPQKKPGRTQIPRLSDRAEGIFYLSGGSQGSEGQLRNRLPKGQPGRGHASEPKEGAVFPSPVNLYPFSSGGRSFQFILCISKYSSICFLKIISMHVLRVCPSLSAI